MNTKIKRMISTGLAATLLAPTCLFGAVQNEQEVLSLAKTKETVGAFTATQGDGGNLSKHPERVYAYENGKQIFRTNGNGDNGTFQDLFVVEDTAFVVVKHYNKGYMILTEGTVNNIGAKDAGRIVLEGVQQLETGAFTAKQSGKRVYVYQDGKQIFRTNGSGNDGTLVGMFEHNGKPYVIVKHSKKGLMVLTDASATSSISAAQVATVEMPITYTATQNGKRVVVEKGQKGLTQKSQIFRTNGAGDDGLLQDAFLIDGTPFVMVKHYKKGNIILADANSGSIAATWTGNYYEEAQAVLTKDGFTATYYPGERYEVVVTDENGKQVFRTNGAGDNGALRGLFVYQDQPYVIVNHWKNGLTILGNRPLPNNTIGTALKATLFQ